MTTNSDRGLCKILAIFLISWPITTKGFHGTKPEPTPFHDFDYFVFSQRWPLTACTEWQEKQAGNACTMPANPLAWTIHGVWPTKIGKVGPYYCPSAIHFNPDDLTAILPQLQIHWINIEANTKPTSFWAHEWKKHGTCASVLPSLDSVPNYFEQGLTLNDNYNIANILRNAKIEPSSQPYDIATLYNAIKGALRYDPRIQCVVDATTKQSYLSEVRLCFNKSMSLIDCDPAPNPMNRVRFGLLTNCNLNKPIYYIDKMVNAAPQYYYDDDAQTQEQWRRQEFYIKIYHLFKTLIWATL